MAHLQASHLFSVQDRVVVITGGGSGLGRTMARALTTNGASKVFVLGRREDALNETVSQSERSSVVIPVPCDVTSKESLEAAYQTIAAQTSHVDLLVANSGTMGTQMRPPGPKADGSMPTLSEVRETLFSIPMEDFSSVLNVNVVGTYYTVLAFLPLLEAANKRRPAPETDVLAPPSAQVIITSSIAGFLRLVPFSYAYNLSKAATTHLVKMLSTTLAPYLIRGLGVSDGSFAKEMIPATRGGAEQDIAGLIVWMASASGGYLNGSIMVTDGGRLGVVPSVY
ncbi:hypothetical protein N7510_004125 [Penicillium lagena]|uniref:uncharacterized protein n=1 Tax=Penicillium lagena TaxID=94218 RepID=UPI00253FF58D|nr:uncharacterized protein N7510_004125 [Penicillium lagena]KAJ5620141.1 hypothetical protein N7510_004125 [Penicillium lagena]